MNKYQKALNEMYAVLNDSERWHKHKEVLQELVDKETPMKPIWLKSILNPTWGANGCGSCEETIMSYEKFCPNCGQKLDWSGRK